MRVPYLKKIEALVQLLSNHVSNLPWAFPHISLSLSLLATYKELTLLSCWLCTGHCKCIQTSCQCLSLSTFSESFAKPLIYFPFPYELCFPPLSLLAMFSLLMLYVDTLSLSLSLCPPPTLMLCKKFFHCLPFSLTFRSTLPS